MIPHYVPNILVCVALLLSIADLIWPTARLTTVAVLLLAVALLAQPILINR